MFNDVLKEVLLHEVWKYVMYKSVKRLINSDLKKYSRFLALLEGIKNKTLQTRVLYGIFSQINMNLFLFLGLGVSQHSE